MHTWHKNQPRVLSRKEKFSRFFSVGLLCVVSYIGGGYTADPDWLKSRPEVVSEKDFPEPGDVFWGYRLHTIKKGHWELTNSRGELERISYFDVVFSPLREPAALRRYRVGREGRLVISGAGNFAIFAYSEQEITVDRSEETLYKMEHRAAWPTPQQQASNR